MTHLTWFPALPYNIASSRETAHSTPTKPFTNTNLRNQHGKLMSRIAKTIAAVCGIIMMHPQLTAADGISANGALVYLDSETSSLWRTVQGNEISLPIDFPYGATSAKLEVKGVKYKRTYQDLSAGMLQISFPAPTSPDSENVYDLTLTFDDGTVQRAKLGVVMGTGIPGEGATRCLLDSSATTWQTFSKVAVMPVPAGTTSLTLNGKAIETGLFGSAGWYALAVSEETNPAKLKLSAQGIDYDALLVGRPKGLLYIIR